MNTFVNFLHAALLAGTPLMFGTLGEIVTEKAGNLNLGVEGMMSIGAIAGFYVGFTTQNIVLAVLGAFLAGLLDRKSTRLNSSHRSQSRMPSSA